MNLLRSKEHSRMFPVLVLAIWTCVTHPAWAINGFVLQKTPRDHWHLVMPREASDALRDSVPGFQAWPDSAYAKGVRKSFRYDEHTAPFAVIRDLNRDGFEDLVLDGHWNNTLGVVLLLSEGSRFRVISGPGLGLPSGKKVRPGHGLRVARATEASMINPDLSSAWVFSWAGQGDDFANVFAWSNSSARLRVAMY